MFEGELTKIVEAISLYFLLILIVGLFILVATLIYLYISDVTQTEHAIRRNYPVIGRLRYLFEHVGEFFRQYFFAMDREELPFNRTQRSWVYRAAKNVDTTAAFGSTKNVRKTGTIFFVNCPFPRLEHEHVKLRKVTIGPHSKEPYETASLFNISGMSFGAISRPAVIALSNGARMAGCWMNTGEGGLSPYHLEGGCDIVFQIGTAKYGVRTPTGELDEKKLAEIAARPNVKMIEIKMSQGAKPGKGGMLPGGKVTEEIAKIRGIPAGQDSISPNRHLEVNSPDALLDTIEKIRGIAGKPVGFKIALGAYGWLDKFFELIHARGIETAPDFITIDSSEGGTGAAPLALIDEMGLPLRESLPMIVDRLCEYGLRDRIKVISSGKLITPADVAWGFCLGTDFITSARGFLFSLGCIQAMQCNKNTCPTGITTHNKRLQLGLEPTQKAVRVRNYARRMEREVLVIAHSCGVDDPRDLGRHHVHIVRENGLSIAVNDLHPVPKPKPQFMSATRLQ